MPSVLIVSNSAYNIFRFRESVWQHFLKEGFTVFATAPTDGYEDYLIDSGVHFLPVHSLRPYAGLGTWDYAYYRELQAIYRQLNPDLIFHFTIKPNLFGTLAASSCGIPSVATITGLGTSWLLSKRIKKGVALLYRYALPKAKSIVCQNWMDVKALQEYKVKAQSWRIVPGSGIDLTHFRPDHSKVADQGKFTFIYVGRMLIEKGLRDLFAAWELLQAQIPTASLLLLGQYDKQHPRTLSPEDWSKGLALPNVFYHEQVQDVRPYIQSSDVVVLPSYREGMPRALLESMAMEKPVISTDVAGCKALAIPGKTGWVVPMKSPVELAHKMHKAFLCPLERRLKLGENGRAIIAKEYSMEKVALKYHSLFNDITRWREQNPISKSSLIK